MPETPLETAQRLWPGEWEWEGNDVQGRLTRPLPQMAPQMGTGVVVFTLCQPAWIGHMPHPLWPVAVVRGDLEPVIAAARDKVQSMARDLARAAGVEVVSEAPPL